MMLNVDRIFFGAPTVLKNGQKLVPLSTKEGRFDEDSRIRFQMGVDQDSMLTSVYGLSTPMPGSDPNRRNMEIVPDRALIEKLSKLETMIVEEASAKSMELFKTPSLTKEFCPLVRSNPATGGQTVRFKVVCEGQTATAIRRFVSETKVARCSIDALGRGCHLLTLVSTPGIWYTGTQFGVSLTASSILVRTGESSNGLCQFHLKPGVEEVDEEDDLILETSALLPASV